MAICENRHCEIPWPHEHIGFETYHQVPDSASRMFEPQTQADILRAAAAILVGDADALDDAERTDEIYGRLRRAARTCQIASNDRGA